MGMISTEKCFYGEVPGRYIIKATGFGKTSPEEVAELTVSILKMAKNFSGKKWAYISDPSRMDPIISEESTAAFVKFNQDLEAAGCCAVVFLDRDTPTMKLLSQKHQNNSNTKMEVCHLQNEAQALEWLKEMGI